MNLLPYRRYDLNLLVVLSAIFEEGSITRASQTLNLTQPAVSHALARLRDVFQDPLFVRRGAAMVPTPLARQMSERIGGALQALSTLTEDRGFDPTRSRRVFKLAMRDVFEPVVLPPLMALLERDGPAIEIHSVPIDGADLAAALRRGAIDLAIDLPQPLGAEITRQSLRQDALVVVARHGHPAVRGGAVDLDAYLAHDHIIVSTRQPGPADAELARLGRHRRIRLRCQSHLAACRVVSRTNLLLTMPGPYAQEISRAVPNQLLAFPLDLPPLDAVMYWHASLDDDPASLWLRQRLADILAGGSASGEVRRALFQEMRHPFAEIV